MTAKDAARIRRLARKEKRTVSDSLRQRAQGRDTTVCFASQGITFALTEPEDGPPRRSRAAVALDLVGAGRGLHPEGQGQTDAVVSCFKEPRDEWRAGLKTRASVIYHEVWPGTDLSVTGTAGHRSAHNAVR